MKRQLKREKRRREEDASLLQAFALLIGNCADASTVRAYFASYVKPGTTAGEVCSETQPLASPLEPASSPTAADLYLERPQLEALCTALDLGVTMTPSELAWLAKRVPRSRATPNAISVAELTFLVLLLSSPAEVRERRKALAANTALGDDSPMLEYYRGAEFARLVGLAEDDPVCAAEWSAFLECIRTPLPMSLRVHSNERALTAVAMQFLTGTGRDTTVAGHLAPVTIVPPALRAFTCSNAVYHSEPALEVACRTLHAASAVSFQEVVSMLPVLVLAPEPHHFVLDMCAAPGSKTLQALDAMLARGWTAAQTGALIASEKDRTKATQTLPSRLKRYHAPNVIVTKCDGMQWPQLYRPTATTEAFEARRFDRIICDVPCSGDGTVRKEPSTLSTWSGDYVTSLVSTQKALLKRGLDLLNVGGILVYSTCSMNVKEDEEVVCSALSVFSPFVELVDVNTVLHECLAVGTGGREPALLRSSGGVAASSLGEQLHGAYAASKVLRVLPHRDDTGGFFIAAFRKVSAPNWTVPVQVGGKLNQWMQRKRWVAVPSDDEEWQSIMRFYGLTSESFSYPAEPRAADAACPSSGMVPVFHVSPSGSVPRRIALVTQGVFDALFHCRPYKGPGLEIVAAGARAFEKYDNGYLFGAGCRWRATYEAVSLLASYASLRKLYLDATAHAVLLEALFRNGFVYLEQVFAILFEKDADRHRAIDQTILMDSAGHAASPQDGEEPSRTYPVRVGGALVCAYGGLSGLSEETGWWLSATVSANKLELAIDVSLRSYGLLAFFGVEDKLGA